MEIGLIELEISKNEHDGSLAEKILKARRWKEERIGFIQDCLKYNVMTPKQFCDLTGMVESNVTYLLKPNNKKGCLDTELDHCYPFRNRKTPGPRFIVINEKCIEYLIKKNK